MVPGCRAREWVIVSGTEFPGVTVPDGEQRFSGVSSEAVAKATGRDWEQWLEFLDGLGAQDMSHREIVALVAGPGELDNGWWQQSVTVGYEQARGLRVVGQTSTADFQIGVQKTLPLPIEAAWGLVADGPGRDVWLGKVEGLEFRKGEKYQASDGAWGEVRSAAPGQRVRLTWCSPDLEQQSTLQVTLVESGEKTSVRFHQEGLANAEERERMRSHWRAVLERLLEMAESGGAG